MLPAGEQSRPATPSGRFLVPAYRDALQASGNIPPCAYRMGDSPRRTNFLPEIGQALYGAHWEAAFCPAKSTFRTEACADGRMTPIVFRGVYGSTSIERLKLEP